MKRLKPLIDNQDIRIDAHQRGNGHDDQWDRKSDDIHIHKTTKAKIKGKKVDVDIRVPINSSRDISYSIYREESMQAARLLGREIAKAFANKSVRERFISELVEILEDYDSIMTSKEKAEYVIKRLAYHFGLEEAISNDLEKYVQDKFASYSQEFIDEGQRRFYFTLTKDRISIGEVSADNKD